MRVDVDCGGVVLVLEEAAHRPVDLVDELVGASLRLRSPVLVVDGELDHGLGGNAALGERATRELVPGGAHAVAGGEEPLHRGHAVVAPVVVIRRPGYVLRAGAPDSGASRMRAEQVGLGGHELRHRLVRLDVLSRPDAALSDGHIEKILPGLRLQVLDLLGRHVRGEIRHRCGRVDEYRATPLLQLVHHEVVTQTGAHGMAFDVGAIVVLVEQGPVFLLIVLTHGVLGLGLEEQEPGADRSVAILETRRHEAIFHHRELGTALGRHRVG